MGGRCTQRGQFRTLTVSSWQTLSGRRLQTGTTSSQHSRDDQQTAAAPRALSSTQLQGTRTVCRVPQQQLPGHSAADSFQGHAATDSVQGPSAAAPRALSREGSCRAVETPNPGVLQRATVLTFWGSAECTGGMAGEAWSPSPEPPSIFLGAR
ncbi:unnamed protein product [Staurois parvus]|uniref:Uncharacterized protein n=1 Tax=Staurois parvus TaxID=386267 RepID=A0ABN9F2V1_9NEOB|nr:unnamed protein product [Staurois parvus]